MNNEKLKNILNVLCREMHEYSSPEKIEDIKKVVKKSVGIFERTSLLSYLLLKYNPAIITDNDYIKKFSNKENSNKSSNATIQKPNNFQSSLSDEETIQLWTNAFFYNSEKNNAFLDFVSKESNIKREDLVHIKKIKNFSFITVKKSSTDKIINRFKTPVDYNGHKISINNIKKDKKND